MVHGAQWNLKLHDNGVCFAQEWGCGVHIFRRKRIVSAFHNEDAILPARIHKDRRDSTRHALGDAHMRRVDPLRFEVLNRGGTKEIAADFRYHSYSCSAKARRNCLIRALASESKIKFLAKDGFARAREDVIERGQVHVGAAYNRNEGLFGHCFVGDDSARGLYKNPAGVPHKLSIAK